LVTDSDTQHFWPSFPKQIHGNRAGLHPSSH